MIQRTFGRQATIAFLVGIAASGSFAASRHSFPTLLNRLPPGILVEPEESRAVLPAGVALRRVSAAGLNLTQISEGWVATLYNDSAGYCTIGYGHLIKKARCNGTEPAEFRQGISKARGAEILARDMSQAEITVMLAVQTPLDDNQYAAIVDFVFNVGGTNFRNSTLLSRLNANNFDAVPAQLGRWTKAGGRVFPGLVTRRRNETALFFAGKAIPRPVPSRDEDLTPIDIQTGESERN